MRRTVLGTGIFNLDTIVVRDYPAGPAQQRTYTEKRVLEEIGGTCGNVVTMLSHLGEQVFPVARFDDGPEGLKLTEDLRSYGCDCRFVSNTPNGGTTTLLCTHKLDRDGNHVLSFRTGSPGGSHFPRRKFIRCRDEAPAFLESLDFTPDVFFFDDPAAGHRVLAKGLREKGTLVYFEPASVKENADLQSVEYSNIVKFSNQNIPDVSFTEEFRDKLFIQTMGSEGLRFNLSGQGWVTLAPVPCDKVADWEGAGDWTSSMFIHGLCQRGILSVRDMSEESVREVLQEAQKVASRSVGYLGSKGIIHAGEI